MDVEHPIISIAYLCISFVCFLIWRSIANNFSGENFNSKWFFICFSWMFIWGMIQLNVARHGYILFFPSTQEYLVNNYWVRWIAFISAIFQTSCIPNKTRSKSWFTRK